MTARCTSLRIRRAERGEPPRWVHVELELPASATLLDALDWARERGGPCTGLAYRAACRHGACGECSVSVDGRGRLSCVVTLGALTDAAHPITVEPLAGLPVLRDLVVDRTRFFDAFRSVRPWLMAPEELPDHELPMTPAELSDLGGADACILCGICAASCPVVTTHGAFRGPAAMLKLLGRANDPRDVDRKGRLEDARGEGGAFRCRGSLRCTESCPRGLDPAQAVATLRRARPRRRVP
jgi:succinate dehydrogenase / fumarate reductase, iron-sulfur subunit